MIKINFSEVLDKLMKAYDIKASELARYISYDPSNISKWRNGETIPWEKNQKEILSKIASYISYNAYLGDKSHILNITSRNIQVDSQEDLMGITYSLLQDGYYKSSYKNKSIYSGREEFTLMDTMNILETSREIILRYISNSKTKAEIYFTSNIFEYMFTSGIFNYNNFIVKDIYFANHILTNRKINIDYISNQSFFIFLKNSIWRNDIYYYNDRIEKDIDFIYCKDKFVLVYILNSSGLPIMMSLVSENIDANKPFITHIKNIIKNEFTENRIIAKQTNSHSYIEKVFYNIKTPDRVYISNSWIPYLFLSQEFIDELNLNRQIKDRSYLLMKKDIKKFIQLNQISMIFDEEKLEDFLKNQTIIFEGESIKLRKVQVKKLLYYILDIYDKYSPSNLEIIILDRFNILPFTYHQSFISTKDLLIFSTRPELVDSITKNYSVKYLPSITKKFHKIISNKIKNKEYKVIEVDYLRNLIDYLIDINNY